MSCFDKIALSCTICTMSCTFTIYAIYPLTFMVYKYSGLQVFDATQNLSRKASYKKFIFLIMKL
jgi:hypothetical protein